MKLHTVPPPATHDLFAMLFHGKKWIAGGLALLLTLSACALSPEPAAEESGYLIYYLARSDESQGGDLIQGSWEQLALAEDAGLTEQARAVVERLIAGPAEDESLRRALGELTPAERRLFTLRFLYQWPSAEIGRTLGLSVNGVDARVARLRRKLKGLLARQGLGWSGKEDGG